MDKPTFKFYSESETMRIIPMNYLVAHKTVGHWLCDFDGAISDKLGIKIMRIVRSHAFSIGGYLLEDKLNDSIKLKKYFKNRR